MNSHFSDLIVRMASAERQSRSALVEGRDSRSEHLELMLAVAEVRRVYQQLGMDGIIPTDAHPVDDLNTTPFARMHN